jgi:DNA-binding NtrC family response regulator
MARTRTHSAELVRTLNAADRPVYLLDGQLRVVFVNQACRRWLGEACVELLGRRCAYHSSPEAGDADRLAAALCPPPTVLTGQRTTAVVGPIGGADEARPAAHPRRAAFIPLAPGGEQPLAIVALVDREDAPAEDVMPESETAAASTDALDPDAVHELIRQFRAEAAARYRADRLVGQSVAIRRVRRQVEVAVAAGCSVLLVGPPGSGRQHVAAAIHYAGDPRRAGSLVPLACSVLGPELLLPSIEALVRGTASGERAARSGLLLTDADQIPPEVQAELAAAVCGRPFPLRLMATAAEPLDELARRGRYRADLAAVLCTMTIALPPLAERADDLPFLAQLFLEDCNARGQVQRAGFAPEALDALAGYSWPGNLDELAQVVAEAHQRAGGPRVRREDLPERIHLAARAAAHPRRPEETIVLDEFLGRMERELIRRALGRAKGNKAKAARLLGLTRPRLYRRMVQLGLEPPPGGADRQRPGAKDEG